MSERIAVQVEQIAESLHATVRPVADETFGDGVLFTLTQADDITLEWFADEEIIRLQTNNMKILLRRLGEPLAANEQVIFSQENAAGRLRYFGLSSHGEITLIQVPYNDDEDGQLRRIPNYP